MCFECPSCSPNLPARRPRFTSSAPLKRLYLSAFEGKRRLISDEEIRGLSGSWIVLNTIQDK